MLIYTKLIKIFTKAIDFLTRKSIIVTMEDMNLRKGKEVFTMSKKEIIRAIPGCIIACAVFCAMLFGIRAYAFHEMREMREAQAAREETAQVIAMQVTQTSIEQVVKPACEVFDISNLSGWCGAGEYGTVRMVGAVIVRESAGCWKLMDDYGEIWYIEKLDLSPDDFLLIWIDDMNTDDIQDDEIIKVWREARWGPLSSGKIVKKIICVNGKLAIDKTA